MSVFYSYARGSTSAQVQTIAAQTERLEKYFTYRFAPTILRQGEEAPAWGGVYADDDTTSGIRLVDRPRGSILVARMESGDHFAVTNLHRAFSRFREAHAWATAWQAKGIYLHILGHGADTSTVPGQFLFQVLAESAEMEKLARGERQLEVLKWRKEHGYAVNQHCKCWQTIHGGKPYKKPVEDPKKIEALEDMIRMREQGMSYDRIGIAMMMRWAATRGHQTTISKHARWWRDWGRDKVMDSICAWQNEKARRAAANEIAVDSMPYHDILAKHENKNG